MSDEWMRHKAALQELDDAVHAYVEAVRYTDEVEPDRSVLAGWAIVLQTQELLSPEPNDRDSVEWEPSLVVAPNMSPFAAAGLLDYGRSKVADLYVGLQIGAIDPGDES